MAQTGATLPTEFDDAVAWAAWLYYVDQMTQSEIAKTLDVSRATIVNYLQDARERGLVSIQLNTTATGRTRLARELMDRYGLQGALVIPEVQGVNLSRRLGEAGARALAAMLHPGDVIGVAWGQTVLAVAGLISLSSPISDLKVVQVSGSSTGERDFAPELCTSLLASRLNAVCANLLAPAVLSSRALKDALLGEPLLRKQFDLIHSTTHILFGVGDLGPKSTIRISGIASQTEIDGYVADGASAVIIGRFIDQAGNPLIKELDERMVGIDLDELRRTPTRLCVAGGNYKVDAIKSTLMGGYATHLVTDFDTAQRLISA